MNFKIISLPCPTTGGSPLLKCQRLTFTGDLANYYWCGLVEILDGTTVITSLPISSAGSYSLTFHATSTSTTIRFTQNATITPWFFLDNILLVKTSNDAIVESYADYYPFGEQLPGRNFTSSLLYKYAYQGQEHDEETGLEAFELRLWDGRIGRWLSTDPYGQYHSPYMGMGNNPVIGIDPNGGFDSKFGAWWYTIFNGGGSIVPDGNGGFDVSQSYYETIGGYDYLGLRMISNRPSSSFNYSIFKGVPVIETPFEGPWGVTLPPYFIATSNNPTQDLLSHEVGHWLEYLDVGTEDFYINYGIPSALNQIENKLFKGTSIPFIVHTRYFTEIDANQRARLNFGYEFDNPDRFPLKNDYTVNQRREINKYNRIQKFSIYFILYHGN